MTAMSATADNAHESAKPKRVHWFLNRAQLLTYKLFFAHLGKFIVVAVYFILLETLKGQHTSIGSWQITLPDVKGVWDQFISRSPAQGGVIRLVSQDTWDAMRHTVFRGVLEGVLGLVLFRQIGFNVHKYDEKIKANVKAGKDKIHWYNKFFASPYQDCPVTPLQYLFLPVLLFLVTVFVGIPLYLGVHAGLDHAAHWTWLEPKLSNHQSIWQKLYVGDYDGLIVGVATGVVAGFTYRAYLYANTMNAARSWVAKDHGPKWWMPFSTRQEIRELCEEGVERQQAKLEERHSAMKVLAPLGVTIAFALAILGYFVIQTNGFS